MKKRWIHLTLAGILSMGFLGLSAQNDKGKYEDLGRIVINPYVSDQVEGLPESAKNMLSNKLGQVVSKNGMAGSSLSPRFIITPNIVVLDKELTATAPPMTAMNLEVTLYIGDGIDGVLFTSTSLQLKGVGTNETKAYMEALKRINPSDPQLQSFLDKGKTKIMEYYNTRCDFILKEAETLAGMNNFGGAILRLTSVPEVCKTCYDQCMNKVPDMYTQYINHDCQIKLNEAQGIWNAGQDIASAEKAAQILATIDPEASCFGDVQKLSNAIAKKVNEIDDREWKYVLRNQEQESERIQAYRDVGVAYGNNQPETVTYNVRGWW